MINTEKVPDKLLPRIEAALQGRKDEINFPPPVFDAMRGVVVDYNNQNDTLTNSFPILPEYLNPYGAMQGGMIAAAVDNTIGPLSLLVSIPSFTIYLNMKYLKAVFPERGAILVTATFRGRKKRKLFFEAIVEDGAGNKLASAEATHLVIKE